MTPQMNPNEDETTHAGEKYAQALAQMTTLDYKLEQQNTPAPTHFISKKVLIYIAICLVIAIVGILVSSLVLKSNSGNSGPGGDITTQQLIDTSKEIQELRGDLNTQQ